MEQSAGSIQETQRNGSSAPDADEKRRETHTVVPQGESFGALPGDLRVDQEERTVTQVGSNESLSDADLRQAFARNFTDLMCNVTKDPLEPLIPLDTQGLELAYKFFMSSTLTIRLAGIAQINVSITMEWNNIVKRNEFWSTGKT